MNSNTSFRQCINATGLSKKTFKTFEEAVESAHKMNENPKTLWKQRAYKCKKCLRFHTGRDPHNIKLIHSNNIYEEFSIVLDESGNAAFKRALDLFNTLEASGIKYNLETTIHF